MTGGAKELDAWPTPEKNVRISWSRVGVGERTYTALAMMRAVFCDESINQSVRTTRNSSLESGAMAQQAVSPGRQGKEELSGATGAPRDTRGEIDRSASFIPIQNTNQIGKHSLFLSYNE